MNPIPQMGGRIIELDMKCPEDMKTMPECNCPFEHWHVDRLCFDIHFEENGEVHLLVMGEDWESDTMLQNIPDLEAARPLAFTWLSTVIDAPSMR